MSGIPTTFAVTTSLSILLHGAVVVGWLAVAEPFSATGQGLQVQLISSYNQTNQAATETLPRIEKPPVKPLTSESVISEHEVKNVHKKNIEKQSILSKQDIPDQNIPEQDVLSSPHVIVANASPSLIASSGNLVPGVDHDARSYSGSSFEKPRQDVFKKRVEPAAVALSTNASLSVKTLRQQHSILELLHSRISDNKEYPYIARRQRREGIAKIGFVLNPDGSIHDARLVISSHANVLDRAALSAVRAIEPFKPAQHYLKQAEAFEIDVVFQLL